MAIDDDAEQVMGALAVTLRAGLAPASPAFVRGLPGRYAVGLRGRLESGEPLARALPAVLSLPEHERVLLEAGERSGSLPDVLDGLIAARRERRKLRRRVLMALAYPLLVAAAASVLLPLPMLFSEGLGAYAGYALPGISLIAAGLVFGLVVVPRLSPASPVRRLGPAIARRLPLLGPQLAYGPTAIFCEVLGRSEAAGVPINAGLPGALRASGEPTFAKAAEPARRAIEQGATLDETLGEVPGLPAEVHRQIALAEQVGKLDTTLITLAEDARARHGRALVGAVIALSVIVLGAVAVVVVIGVVAAAQTFYFDRMDSIINEMGS